jgi:hypothetical protein
MEEVVRAGFSRTNGRVFPPLCLGQSRSPRGEGKVEGDFRFDARSGCVVIERIKSTNTDESAVVPRNFCITWSTVDESL